MQAVNTFLWRRLGLNQFTKQFCSPAVIINAIFLLQSSDHGKVTPETYRVKKQSECGISSLKNHRYFLLYEEKISCRCSRSSTIQTQLLCINCRFSSQEGGSHLILSLEGLFLSKAGGLNVLLLRLIQANLRCSLVQTDD